MSDFMLIEPADRTFSELLSNGVKYTKPRFQRDYSWEQEQWEDLWADIEGLDQERLKEITGRYIGAKDIVSLRVSSNCLLTWRVE